jgi:hypothetical protein
MCGQVVKTAKMTVRGNRESYSLLWNNLDDNGFAIPSGTYFCTLNVGNKIKIAQKLELIR